MVVQDVIIAAAQVVAVFSLVPSMISEDKPALATSAMNMALVTIIATCLLTLHLWISCITAYAIAVAWTILFVQKYRLNHRQAKRERKISKV